MTSKKYSHKSLFNVMFLKSIKKSLFLPVAAFVILIGSSLMNNLSYMHSIKTGAFSIADSRVFDYFFDSFSVLNIAALISFIAAGFINALLLFSFVANKKQNNVYFSLGMSRTQLFVSRYLGGTIPMIAGVVISALVEVILHSVVIGTGFHVSYFTSALYAVLYFLAPYLFLFTITTAVFSGIGNMVEGIIYTIIFAFIPYVIHSFIGSCMNLYTLGGIHTSTLKLYDFMGFSTLSSHVLSMDSYTNTGANVFYNGLSGFAAFSTSIFCLAVTAIIFVIALFAFQKHKNEISGSWGRAKALSELLSLTCGFFALSITQPILVNAFGHGNGNVASCAISLVAFLAVYFITKLIFSSKRKASIISSLKRCPFYIAGFAVIVVVFATGLFGYTSYIPEIKDVKNIEISTQLISPYLKQSYNSTVSDENIAYNDNSIDPTSSYDIFTSNHDEIKAVLKLHKDLIAQGKLNNSDDVYGNYFKVTYTLEDGTKIDRLYSEATESVAKEVISLNDFQYAKNNIANSYAIYSDSESTDLPESESTISLMPMDLSTCHTINSDIFKAVNADFSSLKTDDTFYSKGSQQLGIIAMDTMLFYDDYIMDYDKTELKDGDTNISVNLGASGNQIIIVTSSMKNTIKYLTENNLMQYLKSGTTDNIKSIKISKMSDIYTKKQNNIPIFYGYYLSEQTDTNFLNYTYKYFASSGTEITDGQKINQVLNYGRKYGFCRNDDMIVMFTYKSGATGTYFITAEEYNEIFG